MNALAVHESLQGNQVENSTFGHFINLEEEHLITSNANVLSIYSIACPIDGISTDFLLTHALDKCNRLQVQLYKRITLDGKITSIHIFKSPESHEEEMDIDGRLGSRADLDYLILSFEHAKVSGNCYSVCCYTSF